MAVSWGSARETGTNGVRVGIDLTYSVSGATATVRAELWVWTKQASFTSSADYVRGGTFGSGSGSFSYNHPSTTTSGWSTSNRTRIGVWTATRTLTYGSSQSVSFTGSVSGLGGNMPSGSTSHSRSITLPARPYVSPNAPTGVVASRSSDTSTQISWTRNPTTAGPYSGLELRRRYWLGDRWSSYVTRANLPGGFTSYFDSHAGNVRLEYAVRASNSAGSSAWGYSNTLDTTPSAPSNLVAQSSSSGILVTWVNRAGFTAVTEVQRRENGGAWLEFRTRASGATDATLADPNLTVTHQFRARATGAGSPSLSSGWVLSNVVQLAAAPAAPTNLGGTTPWDATEARAFTWRHVPTDGADQERYQLRHRPVQTPPVAFTEMPVVESAQSRWTMPAGTYTNSDGLEWQVRTWGPHPDPSPWSALAFAVPTARPTVAINTPADGGTVDRSSVLVEWGYDQEIGLPQVAWRWELELDGQPVQERADNGSATSTLVDGLVNGGAYTLRVSVRSSAGMWSAWDTVDFTVDYLPPAAPSIAPTWDMGLGAALIEITQPAWDESHAEPSHHQVWRAINDGPWLLIADDVPLGTSVPDTIPAIGDGTINYYKATTVSVLPSTADSAVDVLAVPTRGKGGTGGWIYLNAGPGMSTVCRVRDNGTRSDSEGIVKVLRHFAGRPAPVEFSGAARSRTWDVSARIAPDYDGASTRDELVDMQAMPAPVCYRDPTGVRWFGSLGPISSSWRTTRGEVSFSMTEVDVVEGLATVQRDVEGGGDA